MANGGWKSDHHSKLNRTMKKYVCLVLLTVVVALAACTDEQEISAIERTETSFSDLIGG